jgi:hypothetical protein
MPGGRSTIDDFISYHYICYMEKSINPNEEKPVKKEKDIKEEPVIHDGSGGAFEGTEMVTEEREDKPRPNEPTPY